MKDFNLRILEADSVFYNGKCLSMVVPTTDGMYGIQAGHTNMVAAVTIGVIKFVTDESIERYASVSGGLIKVEKGDVTILAQSVEDADEIDINMARQTIEEMREIINTAKSVEERKMADARMERAINRLKISKRYGKNG